MDTIAQEYVPGVEFGVFYCRKPSEARGRIISVTEKRLPFVVGDGRRSLERLILDDRRSLGMARFHLRRQRMRLNEIPATGEVVSLGDLGTHCRGALFLDGRAALTPAVERAFDDMSRVFDGFYFGRYDVRARSVEDFSAGRFTVIELNGVTSEATHIYDPRIGFLEEGVRDWRRERQAWCRDDVDPGARSTAAPVSGDGATSPRRVSGDDTRPITVNAIVTSARAAQRINTSAR